MNELEIWLQKVENAMNTMTDSIDELTSLVDVAYPTKMVECHNHPAYVMLKNLSSKAERIALMVDSDLA